MTYNVFGGTLNPTLLHIFVQEKCYFKILKRGCKKTSRIQYFMSNFQMADVILQWSALPCVLDKTTFTAINYTNIYQSVIAVLCQTVHSYSGLI